jgi:hypothetical protein
MARLSQAQQAERIQKIRFAKWRYLLRHRLFRDDIKMFRCTGYAQNLSPEQLFAKCRFPAEILDPSLKHPNEWNIRVYEKIYSLKEDYADPEIFWAHIECGDVRPLPRLNLGARVRLDKVELYCQVFSMVEQGEETNTLLAGSVFQHRL